MSLNALVMPPIDQLGSSTGSYLRFDDETKKWSIIQLNWGEKFLRLIGIAYGSTSLKFIAGQLAKEETPDLVLINKIHQLWHKTYPLEPNPLKSESHQLLGCTKKEILLVGSTYIYLVQNEADFSGFEILLLEENNEEKLVLDVVSSLDSVPESERVIIFQSEFFESEVQDFKNAVKIVLLTIEKYVHEHSSRFNQIVFCIGTVEMHFFTLAVEVCRSIGHPYAQFHEQP